MVVRIIRSYTCISTLAVDSLFYDSGESYLLVVFRLSFIDELTNNN